MTFPSRFVLDVVREMTPGLVPSWNVGLGRWFNEHESTTVDEYAATFLRERELTLFGMAPDPRWSDFYRGFDVTERGTFRQMGNDRVESDTHQTSS